MEIPEEVKRAFAYVAESDMSAQDKLVVAVYLAHGIGQLPDATEEDKFNVNATRICKEDYEWWATTVITMTKPDEPSLAMDWVNLGPSVER